MAEEEGGYVIVLLCESFFYFKGFDEEDAALVDVNVAKVGVLVLGDGGDDVHEAPTGVDDDRAGFVLCENF